MAHKTHYFITERIQQLTFSENDTVCTITLDNGFTVTGNGTDKETSHDAAYAALHAKFNENHDDVAPLPPEPVKERERIPTDNPHPDLVLGSHKVGKRVMPAVPTGLIQGVGSMPVKVTPPEKIADTGEVKV